MLKNESKNLNKKKIVFYSFDRRRLSVFIVTNQNVFLKIQQRKRESKCRKRKLKNGLTWKSLEGEWPSIDARRLVITTENSNSAEKVPISRVPRLLSSGPKLVLSWTNRHCIISDYILLVCLTIPWLVTNNYW